MISLLLLSALSPSASALSYSSGKSYTAGSFSSTNDSTTLECFADAVENYSGTGSSNLAFPIDDAGAYISFMSSTASYYAFPISPYPNYIFYVDSTAWSTDFEKVGKDNVYNDNGDMNYFSGHGASGYFSFAGSSGDNKVTASDTQWGDQDAEVVVIAASKTLDLSGRSSFASASRYYGVHHIMGMASDMDDTSTTGLMYGFYLRSGYTVTNAWSAAASDAMASDRWGGSVRYYTGSSWTSLADTAGSFTADPKAWTASWVDSEWSL